MAKKFKCNICGQTFEAESKPAVCPVCGAPADAIEEIGGGADAPTPKKKKGLDTNSNAYTIIYAAVMVVIVAFLLAFVSSALKPTQDANVENDVKGQILTSLNIDTKAKGFDVAKTFESTVKDMLWDGTQLTPYTGKFNSTYGALIKAGTLHVFVATTADGTKYVIPVTGRGLWGGLWGYIALNEDKQSVYGTYFYHESETAGLGARIGERQFQEKFNGKPLFVSGSNDVALTVVKSGHATAEYEIDGITGATLTSKGVAAMVKDGLMAYQSFIGGAAAQQCSKAQCGQCPKKAECEKAGCQKTDCKDCPNKGQCGPECKPCN